MSPDTTNLPADTNLLPANKEAVTPDKELLPADTVPLPADKTILLPDKIFLSGSNPLVPLATLSGLQSDFEQKMLASNLGGRISTAIKNEARAALTDALRREGIYVQGASLSLSMLLSSGYSAASQNRAQTQLLKPSILKILNEGIGQLTLRVSSVANARSYQVQVQVGNGVWQDAGVFPQARRMVVMNLTPGTMYYIRVRAIGGSTGYSQWSDVNGARSL